jgi:hypothetical protein
MGLHPNPARNWVELDAYIPSNGEYEVDLVDVYGRTVIQKTFQFEQGLNKQRFDIAELSAGMYIVKLRPVNGKTADHIKFIKQ